MIEKTSFTVTIKNEIANLQNKLKIKQEKLDALMKKLNNM